MINRYTKLKTITMCWTFVIMMNKLRFENNNKAKRIAKHLKMLLQLNQLDGSIKPLIFCFFDQASLEEINQVIITIIVTAMAVYHIYHKIKIILR